MRGTPKKTPYIMGFIKRISNMAKSNEPPAEVKAMFDRIRKFMIDETSQNDLYPPEVMRRILEGPAVDKVSSGSGEFGRDPNNPIPVNGFIGELVYISQLRTSGGVQMIGHRLGAVGQVDVFELMSIDGRSWDLLYFDLYHPRKSRSVPSGYRLVESSFYYATNKRVANFPRGFRGAMSECTESFLGIPLVAPDLFDDTRIDRFERPTLHLEALDNLRL